MIKKKFHSKIAGFLLGCILVVGLPFHDFLHSHVHFDELSTSSQHEQEDFHKAENIVSIQDCIACSISQLAHTFFVKSTDVPFVFLAMRHTLCQYKKSQISQITIATDGRAPPVFFL